MTFPIKRDWPGTIGYTFCSKRQTEHNAIGVCVLLDSLPARQLGTIAGSPFPAPPDADAFGCAADLSHKS
jgi:hypothetical protein